MGVRHEWFQTEQYITVTIFAKGVTQDRLQVTVFPNSHFRQPVFEYQLLHLRTQHKLFEGMIQ